MRKLSLLLAAVVCGSLAKAQVPINNSNFLYGQTFNNLQTQTNIGYPMNIPNWQIFEFGTGQFVNNQYRGGNGNDPSAEIYSFGQGTAAVDRALGSVATGPSNSLEAHYGVSFVNNTGSTITTFNVGFRQEQWRVGDPNPLPDTVRCYYSTNATSIGDLGATWTEVTSLMMTSQVVDSTVSGSTLNGNLYNTNKFAVIGVNVPAGTVLRVKFVDRNNPGEDDGLSIDNFYANIGNCAPSASPIIDSAGCYGQTNGQIILEAFGGQAPYSYSLNGGPYQSSNTFSNLPAGVYYIAIQESGNNCVANTNLVVDQRDSIVVNFGVTASSCMDSNGTAWATVTGTLNPYTYSWSTIPVQTNDTAFNVPDGQVSVTVTASDGCSRTDTLTVPLIPLFNGEEICSITVDTAINKNLIIWNKVAPPGSVDKYYIYRADSTAGNYALLDSVAYTAFSAYTDMTSMPSTNFYSYYITAKKELCGESTQSVHHTGKRLKGAYAAGNFILNWNTYVGLTGIDSQYVYWSLNGGPFTLLHTVPITQIGDAHFSPPDGHSRYFVALPKTGGCNPVAKSTAYDLILSNIVENDVVSVNDVRRNNEVLIFPNPSNGIFNLSVKEEIGKKWDLELTDMLGKVINKYSFVNTGMQTVNLVNVPIGTYTVRIVAENKTWVSKITIQ